GRKESARALFPMPAMMRYPGFAQELAAESAIPTGNRTVPIVFFVGLTSLRLERMRAGTNGNDRATRLGVINNFLGLIVRQVAPAHEEHHQVGFPERLQAGCVAVVGRIDVAGGRINRKQDSAFEPVMHRENLSQLRKGFFGMVFGVVAGDKDDVFAVSGAMLAFVRYACGAERKRCKKQQRGYNEQ